MFLFLSKLLPKFLYPPGLAALFALAALFLTRYPRAQKALILGAALVLILGGNAWVSSALAKSLEWRHLPDDIPSADAIVLLGGGMRSNRPPRPTVEVGEAGDRMLYAAHLYREGKAPYILLTSGLYPWNPNETTDAENMGTLMEFLGIPADALVLETKSTNTYENALYSKPMLDEMGAQRILLVTSAMHMPRAVMIFEKMGFDVIPAPTDFQVTESNPNDNWLANFLLEIVPDTTSMNLFSTALKEYIGIFVYRLRGWL